MIPLTLVLRKSTTGYDLEKDLRLNIFLMDELKLFGKSEDQIDSLVQTVQLLSEDIRMEFVLKKCSVLIGDRGMKLSPVGVEQVSPGRRSKVEVNH